MMRLVRELRPLPIAVVASACLLALIGADLLLGRGGAPVSATPPSEATTDVAPPADALEEELLDGPCGNTGALCSAGFECCSGNCNSGVCY